MNQSSSNVNYNNKVRILLEYQKATWPLLSDNYKALKSVQVRSFKHDDYSIKLQYNPKRVRSTNAQVDAESVAKRKCFLCLQNLPGKQKGLIANSDYFILCNPYPIYKEHFTVSSAEHSPQAIKVRFKQILYFSRMLPDFSIIYNGPLCGASAPDHFHLQAGNRGFLPVEDDYREHLKQNRKTLISTSEGSIFSFNNYYCNLLAIESVEATVCTNFFDLIYKSIQEVTNTGSEPMMNIISWYDAKTWKTLIYLRKKHRPRQYFEKGKRKITISPGAVDMGGFCIIPDEHEFQEVTKDDLLDIYSQVTISKELYKLLIEKIQEHK